MRGHYGYDFFEFSPRIAPWDRGFGPFGRGRPPFGMCGRPDFDRHGCRPHGPPGFHHGPGFPYHESDCHGYGCPPPPPHHEGHHRHHEEERHGCTDPGKQGPPGCGNRGYSERNCEYRGRTEYCSGSPRPRGPPPYGPHGFSEGHSVPPYDRGSYGYGREGPHDNLHGPHEQVHQGQPENNNKPSEYPRRPLDHDYEFRGRGAHGHPSRRGTPRHDDHHHHDHGYGPRDACDWHQGHRRPGPYDRIKSGPCCSVNRAQQVCNRNESEKHDREQCDGRNKDRSTAENTVLVQRIVVERAPIRPQSI